MKKIKPSPLTILYFLIPITLFISLSGVCLCREILGLTEEKWAGYLAFAVLFSASLFLLWALNRTAPIVWVENGILKRRGLLYGFYKECPIKDIQTVKERYVRHDGDYIYIINNSTHQFNQLRKDSYICFRKTKKNLQFLNTFWHGNIQNATLEIYTKYYGK